MYCFDTSAFMDAWSRWHPIDVFPCVWERFETALKNNRIVAPYLVLTEILQNAIDLNKWINARHLQTYFINDTSEVRELASEIMEEYRDLVDIGRERQQADPNVIALSMIRGLPLVTGEKPRKKVTDRHKIPDVCIDKGVEWFNVVKFMKREKWCFNNH